MKTNQKLPMRNKFISAIWVIAKELGINKEYLHVLVYCITGGESIKALSEVELKKVVDHLKKEQAKFHAQQKRNERDAKVHRLPTPQQRYYCSRLLLDAKRILDLKDPNAYLESIAKRMFDKPVMKLDRKEFGSLIKQLTQITKASKKAQ